MEPVWNLYGDRKTDLVTCPICRYMDNVVHSIEIYALIPLKKTEDGSVVHHVGMCGRRDTFILQTDQGWYLQSNGSPVEEFFGDPDDDIEEEVE